MIISNPKNKGIYIFNKVCCLFLTTCTMFLLGLTLNAQEFHVSLFGNDESDGSASEHWRTLQHAMDNATVGSTVLIHGGVYPEELYVNVSGEEGQYITFKAVQGEEVVIDASNNNSTAVIELYDVHHIAIEDVIITNHETLDATGIIIEGSSDHIRIKNCEIYNIHFSSNPNDPVDEDTNAHAIAVYGDESTHPISDIEILNNVIHDCRLGYSEALVLNGNVTDFVVEGNQVYDVSNIGIDIIGHEGTCDDPEFDQARNGIIKKNLTYNCLSPYASAAGIYVDGGKNLIIEQNIVHSNQWGIEIGCENVGTTTDNVIVRNNFIYNNKTAGLAIGGYNFPNGSGKVTNVIVTNNTLYGNDTEDDYTGEIYLSYTEQFNLSNNIIYGTSPNGYLLSTEDLTPSLNIDLSNNNWYSIVGTGNEEYYFNETDYQGLTDFISGSSAISSGMNLDPLFESADLSDLDLHLSFNSPMINVGIANDFMGDLDIDDDPRILKDIVDMGADEDFGVLSNSNVPEIQCNIFPNPGIDEITVFSNKGSEFVSLIDELGVIIQQKELVNGEITFNVADLDRGVYFLQIDKGPIRKLILVK